VKDEELIGAMIVSRALSAPLKRIAENAGQNGAVIAERVRKRTSTLASTRRRMSSSII